MASDSLDNLFFKTAVHQCNDLVVVTDANALIIYVNPAFEKHIGFKLKLIKGKNISIIKSGVHNESFYKKLWSKIQKGFPVSQVFINKKKNGELYYENKTITPIKNKKGKIEYYLSTSKDITKEIKLQQEVVRQKDFIQTAIQNTDALIVGLDKSAKIVLFNKACENLTGYSFSEVQGKIIFDVLLHKSTKSENKTIFKGILENGTKFKKNENIWITKLKKEILIKWSNTIINDINKEGLLVLSTGINVTKEKQSEKQLILLNNQLDEKVKQRTNEIERLNNEILINNKLLNKVTIGIPAIIYLLNVETKIVKLLNNSINEFLLLPEKQNGEINYKDFIKYFSTPNSKLISINKFCNEKINKEYDLNIFNKTFQVQNKTVIFEYDSKDNPIEYLGFITDISSTKVIQNRLEESQKLAHIGTWEWNMVTNELYWSDEIYRIFGINSRKFQPSYQKFLETIHQGDRKLVEDAVNRSLEKKEPYEITHRIEPKPGIIKFVTEKGFTEYDLNGKPTRMIGTIKDITETEYFRERLEESQKIAKLGTWEWNISDDELFWSNEMYNIHELNRNDLKMNTENLTALIHPDDKKIVLSHILKAAKRQEEFSIEYRIITKLNQIKHVINRGHTEISGDGKYVRVLGVLQDITEEKLLKNKLQSSYITLENSLNAIFTSNLKGQLEYANQAAVKMWGYSNLPEMLMEKPMVIDYWHNNEIDNIYNCTSIVKLEGKFETDLPYKAIKKNGDVILVKFNASIINDDHGKPIALTGSFFDVTEEIKIKKEIEEYDKKLNLLLSNIDEVVYGIEPSIGCQLDGKIFFLSGKAKVLFGFDLQDSYLNPDIWRQSLHPDDIQVMMDSTFLAVREKRTTTREYRMKNKITGAYAWFEDKVSPQFDSEGTLIAYFGSSRDISEKKKTNDLLKESEEKYRLISDNNHDLITLRDEKGNSLFVSNSIKSLLGYTSDEYSNLNIIDLIHPIDKESAKKLTADSLFVFKETNTTEARIKHKDGHYIWMQAVSNPIYDDNGNIKHVVGSSRDITERKKLEFNLIDNEKKYRSLFENALVGIFIVCNRTQKAFDVNNVCIELLGYDNKNDFLKNFNAIKLYASDDDRKRLMFEIEQSGQITDQIITLNKKDGSVFWGRISFRLIADEGTIEGVIVDVTQRKVYEEQLQKNIIEKDLLLKEIHHRVKNNLQIISSLLKLQQNKLDDPKLKEPLLESRERIRAIALIHEKLYLSNDISTINFSEYLMNLTRPMHLLNKEKKINVTFDLVEYLTDINIAIPLGLTCYEIISNAFKHAFKIKNLTNIDIRITKTKAGYELVISDNGDGFDINAIDVSKSLGWSLITNLIKQINGTITIHSEIGVGSEFKIALNNECK